MLRVSARWIDLFDWRVWTLRLAPVAALLALLAVLPAGPTTLDAWIDGAGSLLADRGGAMARLFSERR